MPADGQEGRYNDEGSLKPLQGWEYADLVLDLTPGTGRGGLIRATPRLEAVLGKPHCTAFESRGQETWTMVGRGPRFAIERAESGNSRPTVVRACALLDRRASTR